MPAPGTGLPRQKCCRHHVHRDGDGQERRPDPKGQISSAFICEPHTPTWGILERRLFFDQLKLYELLDIASSLFSQGASVTQITTGRKPACLYRLKTKKLLT